MDDTVNTDTTYSAESQSFRSSATSSTMTVPGILVTADSVDSLLGSSSSSSSKMMKRVSFYTVDICEHAICLGDNVVSTGAPLTIEWHAQSCEILSVDEYERERSPSAASASANGRQPRRRRSSSITTSISSTGTNDDARSSVSCSNFKNNRPRKLTADERFCLLSLNGIPMRTSLQAAAEASKARKYRQETVEEVLREQEEAESLRHHQKLVEEEDQQQEQPNHTKSKKTKIKLFGRTMTVLSKLRAR